MTLEEFRAENPDYNDLSDGELSYALWDSNYKDTGLPMGMFADQIKLSTDQFNDMIDTARAVGYQPTTETLSETYEPTEGTMAAGRALTAMRGATAGISENIAAATAAGAEKVFGDRDRSYGEAFKDYLNIQRDVMDQYRQARPKESMAIEIGSSIVPILATGGGATTATGLKRAAGTAAAGGFTYGAATGGGESTDFEEDVRQRAEEGVSLMIPSALFGAGGQFTFNVAKNVARRLKNPLDRANTNPIVENLGRLKTAAYKAVENKGINFNNALIQPIREAVTKFEASDFFPSISMPQPVKRANELIKTFLGKNELSITELDSLRQRLYKIKGDDDELAVVKGYINIIDDAIQGHPDNTGLMNAARAAHSRYRKAQELAEAFAKASDQAKGTGLGGNVYNLYKQAINNLLKNKNTMKYYSDDEIVLMREFLQSEPNEQLLRTIGRLDPSAGGLTLLLQAGAAYADPLFLGSAVLGGASRRAAEGQAIRRGEQLLGAFAEGTTELPRIAPTNISGRTGQTSAMLTQSERERQEELNRLLGRQ